MENDQVLADVAATVVEQPVVEAKAEPTASDRIAVLEQKVADIFAGESRIVALENKVAKVESENESLHKRLDSLTDELEKCKAAPAAPVAKGTDEGRLVELESKVAKLDEFLGPHGHNRVIPEVVEPQCQSEIAEPQTE